MKDSEAGKRMAKRCWFPALKEFYEPEDVVRYFRETSSARQRIRDFNIRGVEIIPPDRFFTPEVLEAGIELMKKNG